MLEVQDKIIKNLFKNLWNHYKNKVTQVKKIKHALKVQGEQWSEDHIAFRTLPGEHCGLHILQNIFALLGYKKTNEYQFQEKKLIAVSLDPPQTSSGLHSVQVFPKIFLSQLELNSFSPEFQKCVLKYTNAMQSSPLESFKNDFNSMKKNSQKIKTLSQALSLFLSVEGRRWQSPTFEDYEILRKESEYAAWTLIFGNTPNHFTLGIHLMTKFSTLSQFNEFIEKTLKIRMNDAGGSVIKGSPEVFLEQSATLAEDVVVCFQDGFQKIPYAFVEFAYRYPLAGKQKDGLWESYYQGFVTDNADKIFESTNTQKSIETQK